MKKHFIYNLVMLVLVMSGIAFPKDIGILKVGEWGCGQFTRVVVQDNYAYCVSMTHGLAILDISQPSSPQLTAIFRVPGGGAGVAVKGNYAYLNNQTNILRVIDISTAAKPMQVATYKYENGVHSIHWTAADDAGNTDGIGSRYFTIQNSSGTGSLQATADRANLKCKFGDDTDFTPGREPLAIKKGFSRFGDRQIISPDDNGTIAIELRELERLEIQLPGSSGTGSTGYQSVGRQRRSLPVGSTLNLENRTFSWIPGPGHLGEHVLVFSSETPRGIDRYLVRIIIRPGSR